MATATIDQVTTTLTEQHQKIKTMMATVQDSDGDQRKSAFTQLCSFLAAHEAAEEECIHAVAKQDLSGGDTQVVDKRVEEEDEAGKAITELEGLGTDSPEFAAKFEQLSKAVIAHAEAEEHQELPKLAGIATEDQLGRMQEALSRVPQLASRNSGSNTSFKDQLQAAKSQFAQSTE